MNIKTLLASAAFVASSAAAAYAVPTYTGDLTNNEVTSISAGDTFTMNVTAPNGDGAGSVSYGFTASAGAVYAFNVSTDNPNGSFADLVISWTENQDGTGTTFDSISGGEIDGAHLLTTTIGNGETKYLFASWSGVNSSPFGEADVDFNVAATTVPVPAGGLLLISALGGVAAMRRRKKS